MSLELLATEARDRGDDPRQLSIDDPRVRLAHELATRSKEGQMNNVVKPYMVINTLAMWPDSHNDSKEEMASKLLGWAVEHAEGRPIWTQIPEGQMGFFLRAGFREVAAFTLNLNGYTRPGGTDLGTQEWVQMVYRERRARSISPGDTGGRRRRLSC